MRDPLRERLHALHVQEAHDPFLTPERLAALRAEEADIIRQLTQEDA